MILRNVTFAVAATTLMACSASAQQSPADVEVTSEELAPGVAVLFTGRAGNMGVSFGEDATVLIDDQFEPFAPAIEAAIAGLGASPVKYVVNTHWHGDHTGGNEHFGKGGATIFAHDQVRVRMADPSLSGRDGDPASREALPVVTYDQGIKLHLNDDTLNIMFLGGGHTDGDSVVFWEKANVVHMGDLYFKIPGYPFIDISSGGSVYNAMDSLDLVISMIDAETKVIPGHGPMSDKAELVAYRAMIGEAVNRVEVEAAGEGATLESVIASKPLADFDRGEGGFIDADAFITAIWNSEADFSFDE